MKWTTTTTRIPFNNDTHFCRGLHLKLWFDALGGAARGRDLHSPREGDLMGHEWHAGVGVIDVACPCCMLTRGMRGDTSGNPPTGGASMRGAVASAPLSVCARGSRYPTGRAEPGWFRPLQVTSLRAPNVDADPLIGMSHHFPAGHGPPRSHHPTLAAEPALHPMEQFLHSARSG